MTVFCAKLYGSRSQKSKKMETQEIDKIVNVEHQQMQLTLGTTHANPVTEDSTQPES